MASGVVKGAGRRSPPTIHSIVPTSPAGPPCRVEHGLEEERRRGLAVRPRDPGHLELSRRLPEERIRGDRHRRSDVRYDDLWNDDIERPLDDQRHRTSLDGLPGEVVAVDARARDAEVEGALRDAARVEREVSDLDRPGSGHLARCERPDQGVELHLEIRLLAA